VNGSLRLAPARRVLLINPHWSTLRRQRQGMFRRAWPPLDLALAAQMLEDDGLEVRVVDNNVERHTPKALGLLAQGYDAVFVTTSPYDRWQCPALDITFFYETLRHLPRERLVVMGAHISERPEIALRETGAAGAILHEPEVAIREVCRQGLRPGQPGVACLTGDELEVGPASTPLDLESAPFPAFHRLPMDRYHYELMGRAFTLLEASRGCPYRCSFCYLGMYGARFRQKSVDRFFEEIQWAVTRHGRRNIYFMDLEFALNRRFVWALCERILARGLQVRWCCQTRVTDVDDELVALMKRAGCRLIHFGVESGSVRVLRETGKGITLDEARRAIAVTRRQGVASAVFLNLGFPGETREEIRATRDFAVELDPSYASFHLVIPFPGTPLARQRPMPSLAPAQYPQSTAGSEAQFRSLKRDLRLCYAKFYLRPRYLRRALAETGGSMLWQHARTLSDLVFS
jgi:radical SAM superfamily enzyme YgiQ (UPF0313 family)